ncbi:MAG TPA: DUF2065 domain-containing protein [Chromatiales bacterium]|nr:DUF2065 domain-containing protein [Thiotrichales bacterium]HIP69372.1 DUF2065 domain-containing protein [Chromatiales bacterium]
MNWSDIGAAIALLLVFEGLLPFLSPRGFKQSMSQIGQIPDKQLRIIGLVSMLGGLVLLYWIRA